MYATTTQNTSTSAIQNIFPFIYKKPFDVIHIHPSTEHAMNGGILHAEHLQPSSAKNGIKTAAAVSSDDEWININKHVKFK